jgi:hypothetical protein
VFFAWGFAMENSYEVLLERLKTNNPAGAGLVEKFSLRNNPYCELL